MDTELREQLKSNFRKEVFDVIQLISSKEEQLDYQVRAPIAYVSSELFNQWEECYQIPKVQSWFQEAFSNSELVALSKFDLEVEAVANTTPQELPDITEFVETKEWKRLSNAAVVALHELKK
jgi:hypothetical protein